MSKPSLPPLHPKDDKAENPRNIFKRINKKFLLNTDDYEIIDLQKKVGGFGIVKFVRNKATGKIYAAKSSHQPQESQQIIYISRELKILATAQHPSIVNFHGYSTTDFNGNDNITIFTDYMENGSLSDLLKKERMSELTIDFNNTMKQIILIGIASGMLYLHKHHIIHRDLKPDNILLDKEYKPYITDFGLSKIFDPDNSKSQSIAGIGTLAYMAPEIIESKEFNTKVDVYSFGILMFEIVTGIRAYDKELKNAKFNAYNFQKKVVKGLRPKFPKTNKIKRGIKLMIKKCWSYDPNERPTFSEIYDKLSLSDNMFYTDLHGNLCEPAIDDYDEEYDDDYDEIDDDDENSKYCLDNVKVDILNKYIKEINKDDEKSLKTRDESQLLKKEIEDIKEYNKKIEKKLLNLVRVNRKLQHENVELKDGIMQLTSDNSKLKEDVEQIKELFSNLNTIIDKKSIVEPHQPSQYELEKQCFDIADKVRNGKDVVYLPEFLQRIPDDLFSGLSTLRLIKIPLTVTSIGSKAFFMCSSLQSIEIPSAVTSIGESAFHGCRLLKSVEIPSKITKIENNTFHGCSSLKKVEVPSSVTSIGENAFSNCLSIEEIIIPSSVTTIGSLNFTQCKFLKSIQFPKSVTTIGSLTFYQCSSLASIKIPSPMTTIQNRAFDGCSSLTSVKIPSSVTSIGDYAFNKCSSLKNIEIPSSVTSIGNNAFNNCISLDSFEIQSSVKSIGSTILSGCSSLKTLIIKANIPTIKSILGKVSSVKSVKILSPIKSICDSDFSGFSSLTSVSIPSSVTSIGNNAFNGCKSLTSINIPSSVTSIGNNAFDGCQSLTSIVIPSSVKCITSNIFNGCKSLTSISIPSSVTIIEYNAFNGCQSLKSISIPSSVTSIEYNAFDGCQSLTSIVIPSSVKCITSNIFNGCKSLINIELPPTIKSIDKIPLHACKSLNEIESIRSESIISVKLDPGSYKIEVWGAQGGNGNSPYFGGYGGYSTGTLNCKTKMTLYGVVGQTTYNLEGGFNGGGSGSQFNVCATNVIAYGGGGATHIGFLPGLLSSLQSEYSSHLLLVAGGGGGSIFGPVSNESYRRSYLRAGSCGGGYAGQRTDRNYYHNREFSKPSGFGFGGSWIDRSSHPSLSGGGAGLYGGASGIPGGGGSGYINTLRLEDSFMCGYCVTENNQPQYKTFSTTNISSDAISKYAKIGNGHIRITCISKD